MDEDFKDNFMQNAMRGYDKIHGEKIHIKGR
jgi:hypothetical protein